MKMMPVRLNVIVLGLALVGSGTALALAGYTEVALVPLTGVVACIKELIQD